MSDLFALHHEPWPGDGSNGYQCAGCQRDMYLRPGDYEPRGLCDSCVDEMATQGMDLQQQLAATTEYANVLRVQLAAVVSARDAACKMLDWIDARYLPPGMTTYRLLELLAAGKEDK